MAFWNNILPKDNSDLIPLRGFYRFDSWAHLLVIIAFVLSCCMRPMSWHMEGVDSLLRYIIALSLLLSLNWVKWDKFKVFLVVFLLMAVVVRRWLVVWTLFTMVYQIDYLKIPIKRLAAIALVCLSVIIVTQVVFVLCGIWENAGVHYEKSNKILYDLGSGNANRISTLLTFSMFCLYILLKDHYRILFPIISLSLGFVFFQITGSRTTFYAIIILNVLALAYWAGIFWNWTKYIIALVPIVLFIGTFYLAANMESNEELSESASGRLYYILKFTREFGGREWMLGTVREDEDPLDSSYLDIIVVGGITFASFFCAGFGASVIRFFRKIKSYLPFMLAFLAAGISETYLSFPDCASVILWAIVLQVFIKYKPILE